MSLDWHACVWLTRVVTIYILTENNLLNHEQKQSNADKAQIGSTFIVKNI